MGKVEFGTWTPFKVRPLAEEEKDYYKDFEQILDGSVPEDGQEILVSEGKSVWADTFMKDNECYLDSGYDIKNGMAWMPLPEPYKTESEG